MLASHDYFSNWELRSHKDISITPFYTNDPNFSSSFVYKRTYHVQRQGCKDGEEVFF